MHSVTAATNTVETKSSALVTTVLHSQMTHQVASCPGHQVRAPLPEMHGVGVQLPETLPSPVITVSIAPKMTRMKEKKDRNKEM